ncbi:MAG TPA: sodium-translocating pyrophosphatase [Phycisphaerales bacterium]|nr:sodium-translocating pyrophosphatase [Phycisphaerales bacterium]HIB01066.1 sodium-translocating pyrophosphatase [Phycisphaerales bacterium]HIN84757.1 sodium-translocating pyrophosphatase [Phycisphaerales bacterium]HIO52578.1 sodium-translocating pyrophosphatase [Phycisphaerales bacterium]
MLATTTPAGLPDLFYLAPVGAIVALIMAFVFSRNVMAHSEGEPEMIEIAGHVRAGAMAYLKRQYKVVFVVFIVLVAVLALLGYAEIQPIWSAVGVPIAGLFSGLCGWFGMKMATNASARTTWAVKQSLNEGLKVAFRAGAVMGLIVVGFALLDVSVWFYLWNEVLPEREGGLVEITSIMLTFGMGASTQALFARVGGGIYTKAADVGADLVGKVEAGIPEDDPRNPATIADNVGDNVGDVAGMGADLYESYYGSILATMALGAAAAMAFNSTEFGIKLAVAPMALAGLGIFCSLVGVFVVRAKENASFSELLKGLHKGVYVASFLIAVLCGGLFYLLFRDTDIAGFVWWGPWASIITGLVAGLLIAYATEYYTSYEHAPTQRIAKQTETGAATVIIAGIAEGMISTWAPLIVIVVAIISAFTFSGGNENFLLGLYGVGIAAVGMLSTLGITLATDAYGPIADNAGGNAEMTGQPPIVRERTDMLDSLGNTTAATGKGFAIGSAALTALALLAAYVSVVQTSLDKKITQDIALVAEAENTVAYLGNGEFVVNNGGDTFGGLMIASNKTKVAVENLDWAEGTLAADFAWSETENTHAVTVGGIGFSLVPSHKAKIKQLLSFYDVTIMNPKVLGGIFLGVMLAFVFCALTMNAVGRAAYQMMNECRRQFGIMKEAFKANGMSDAEIEDPMNWPKKVIVNGHQFPDYGECVDISTSSAQREMVFPAILAISVPIIVGLLLGVGGVMGLLVGGLTSGFAVAIYMANAGGAWDNAKKYIESGKHGGKGSDAHKASVVGDTVGDPFKDTSGPALNILIKLIAIVSVVFAGLVVNFGPVVAGALGL